MANVHRGRAASRALRIGGLLALAAIGSAALAQDSERPAGWSEDSWPLIARILADDVYAARYRQALEQALDGMLAPDEFDARVRELHTLVAPFVVGPDGERPSHTTLDSAAAFQNADDQLIDLMAAQRAAARSALAAPR